MSLDIEQGSGGNPTAAPPAASATHPAPPTARVRERRRPLLFALMAALVAAGGLLAAFAFTTVSDSRPVVVVTDTVHRGEIITGADVHVAHVSLDPALAPVPGSELQEIIGQRAAIGLPAGGLVTRAAVTNTVVPAAGESIVGVSLTPAQMPSTRLHVGDNVRIVSTPGDQGEVTGGSPETVEAAVVGLERFEATGETVVDVVVPHAQAAPLAAMAATRKVALVLDERER